jgi:sugar porter (SP) family MFS transporter
VIASVLPAPDFLRVTGLEGDDTSTQNYIGFITSSMLLGAFVGCIPASLIADAFSRRVAITVGAVIFLVGGVLQTAATNKEMMMAGRFFAGVAIGQLSLLAPLYQSEISHPSIRGRLTTLQQLFLGLGAFVAGWVGWGMTKYRLGTPEQWRVPLGLQMVPALPLLFVSLVLPESPRWLVIRGREEEALRVLARLHARGDVNDPLVQGEFAQMRSKVAAEAAVHSGWAEIFGSRQNLRKVMLGVILQFSVQMTGVSFLQYYAPKVYGKVGYSVETTLLLGSLSGVLGILAQFSCVVFVDRTGRRWPLIIGNALSGFLYIWNTYISRMFEVGEGTGTQARAFVAVGWLWNMIFSACIGPLSWA